MSVSARSTKQNRLAKRTTPVKVAFRFQGVFAENRALMMSRSGGEVLQMGQFIVQVRSTKLMNYTYGGSPGLQRLS